MKTIILITFMFSGFLSASPLEVPLLPDGVNQILSRIHPDMREAQVEKIVKTYYPDAKTMIGIWSGHTGYIDFKLTSRYSISIAAYNDPKDFNSRFVHTDLIFYFFDFELKQKINISFHKWEEDNKEE